MTVYSIPPETQKTKISIRKIMLNFLTLKNIYAFFLGIVTSYILPNGIYYAVAVALVFLDMLIGTLASFDRGETWQSRKIWKSIFKLFVISWLLFTAALIEKAFIPTSPAFFTYGMMGLIVAAELTSIDENYYSLFGYRPLGNVIKKIKYLVTPKI